MALISSRVPLQIQAPDGWRKLWEQAQREGDPKKLDTIIKQVHRLITEHEERLLSRKQRGSAVSVEFF
jgi:hypothetical protein